MSNLKDTDFDDLFRRASDKYPLRTDSADWEKMAAALDQGPTASGFDGADAGDKRRKRRFFWLLLLLPLGGAGYYTWNHSGHGTGHPAVAVVAGQDDRQTASSTADGRDPVSTTGGQKNVSTAGGQGNVSTAAPGVDPRASNPSLVNAASANRQLAGTAGTKTKGNNKRINGNEKLAGALIAQSGASHTAGIQGRNQGSQVSGTVQVKPGPQVIDAPHAYITTQPFTLEWAGDVQRARIAGDYHLSVEVIAPPAARNADPAKPKKPKTSYLYAGILGAPDFSTVKMQSIKGVGTTVGVLVGYAFNPRWSVETGAYIESKKYYTDGEYFKKSLPYGAKLLNVNGTCYMWEIPVNVRYTFNPDAKTKWFATGGLSTYLMSKENYTYAYESSGGWNGQGAWKSTKASQYPFSIVNLSAGFEQRLGGVGSLRVEPYLRLPLEGIGTGKLPIMSAGVNIGITRRLW
jgi:hypothetical protein